MADATYQPKIYKKQGGDELVVTSSGTLTLEGTQNVASGGSLVVASGGTLNVQAGSAFKVPFLAVSSSATTIPAYGISHITGTTVGPTYLIANPVIGAPCWLVLNPSSSGVTHRAIITGGTTDITFRLIDGYNKVTLATSALRSISLVGVTTNAYQIVGTHSTTMTLGLGTS